MSVVTLIGANNTESVAVDGTGLRTREISEFDRAVLDNRAYSFASLTYDYDAIDTILGVENNSSAQDLVIQTIFISSDTLSEFVVHSSSGATMTGTAVTPVNLNRNSGLTATGLATAKCDETGNGQQAAGYTGRLLTGRVAADSVARIDVNGAIVLPLDFNVGVDLTDAGTAANVTIIGYFRDRS